MGVAVRKEGVPSLCLSSSLKLFNLSERRHDISKLHPKVSHSCGEQRDSGQRCLQGPHCKLFEGGAATFSIPPSWCGNSGGKAPRLPSEFVRCQLNPSPLSPTQTWLLGPLVDFPKASSPTL